jgi:pilus assembly protein CpaB
VLSTVVYKQFQKASAVKPVDTEHVVVAASAMPLGTRVDASNLKLISWPAGQSVAGMFNSIDQAANRALITPVAANEMILDGKLAPKEAGAGLPAVIPQGMRAMSVAVNDVIGVAGFVTPGTKVDVLVTGKLVGPNHTEEDTITRTILENVGVLAAGQKIEQDREGKPQTVPVITLLVSPEDAARLAMASTQGKIQLALRNTVDTKRVDPPSVLEANLFSGASAQAAPAPKRAAVKAPAAPAPYTIEVITGSKRENKSFPNQ